MTCTTSSGKRTRAAPSLASRLDVHSQAERFGLPVIHVIAH